MPECLPFTTGTYSTWKRLSGRASQRCLHKAGATHHTAGSCAQITSSTQYAPPAQPPPAARWQGSAAAHRRHRLPAPVSGVCAVWVGGWVVQLRPHPPAVHRCACCARCQRCCCAAWGRWAHAAACTPGRQPTSQAVGAGWHGRHSGSPAFQAAADAPMLCMHCCWPYSHFFNQCHCTVPWPNSAAGKRAGRQAGGPVGSTHHHCPPLCLEGVGAAAQRPQRQLSALRHMGRCRGQQVHSTRSRNFLSKLNTKCRDGGKLNSPARGTTAVGLPAMRQQSKALTINHKQLENDA